MVIVVYFPRYWGGHTHEISPTTEKVSPPRLGGEQRFPPTRSDLEGISLHLWGGTTYFLRPPKFGGDAIMGKCKFPPKCDQFWRGRDTFSPANLQTCKKCRLGGGGTRQNVSPPKHLNPPQSSPHLFEKDPFCLRFFSVSPPPIGGINNYA